MVSYRFGAITQDLRSMPREIRREITPALRNAAQPVLIQAKANASWSTRIPASLYIAVLARGVRVRARASKAPHARVYEGIGTSGPNFRHPLFGDKDHWVAQRKRPFLAPAGREAGPAATQALIGVVDDVAGKHGFR